MPIFENRFDAELSRRSLLQNVACAAGAVGIVSLNAGGANAAKAPQKSVAYQVSPKGVQKCDNCSLWEAPNACKSVDGTISPQGWCMIYKKAP
jgi:High potential iron-sulfur protein